MDDLCGSEESLGDKEDVPGLVFTRDIARKSDLFQINLFISKSFWGTLLNWICPCLLDSLNTDQ